MRRARYTHCHNPKCRAKLESDNAFHQVNAVCSKPCEKASKEAYAHAIDPQNN